MDARRSDLRMRMTDLLGIEARLLRAAGTMSASLTRSDELHEVAAQILAGVKLTSRSQRAVSTDESEIPRFRHDQCTASVELRQR